MNKKQKKRECGSLGRYFAVFIIPALAIYLIFSILPFMYTIFYSFTDYTDMNPTNLHFVAFQNYIKVFQTPLMRDCNQEFIDLCHITDWISGNSWSSDRCCFE